VRGHHYGHCGGVLPLGTSVRSDPCQLYCAANVLSEVKLQLVAPCSVTMVRTCS
jgi:hypothetical protein